MDDDREYQPRRYEGNGGDSSQERWQGRSRSYGRTDSRPPRAKRPPVPADNRFPPTMEAAERRLERIRPTAYAKTRNFVDGAVTRLSPYLTHGFLTVPGCIEKLSLRHTLTMEDKLIYEFAWREYFHHVWSRLGDGILGDIRNPVWRGRYQPELPDDIRHGATGVAAIDQAVRILYADGYLHNHLRMWLASYVVHIRKVDWKAGAAWMYSHLLDGDLASNALSWQWVAGTFAHKPYLFNAENVSRYWAGMDCSGTVIDTSYVDLEAIARGRNDMGSERGHHPRIDEPGCIEDFAALLAAHGFETLTDTDMSALLDRQHIELRHPWDLSPVRENSHAVAGWLDVDFHARFRWSKARWEFVLGRLRTLTNRIWVTSSENIARQTVRMHGLYFTDTLNPGYVAMKSFGGAHPRPGPRFFLNPPQLQPSFTRFFDQAMAGREIASPGGLHSRHSA